MNKQELIEKYKSYEGKWGAPGAELARQIFIEDLKLLDEPETGHTDEAPRYVKNILARLRELPVHDRKVWLKAIMGEFEGVFEPEKVTIPQFVADWIEEARKSCKDVADLFDFDFTNEEVGKWFMQERPFDLVARAWLDGYEVEKEKRYFVKIRATKHCFTKDGNGRIFFSLAYKSCFTQTELEKANFGWVFDCEGIEIEEEQDDTKI